MDIGGGDGGGGGGVRGGAVALALLGLRRGRAADALAHAARSTFSLLSSSSFSMLSSFISFYELLTFPLLSSLLFSLLSLSISSSYSYWLVADVLR